VSKKVVGVAILGVKEREYCYGGCGEGKGGRGGKKRGCRGKREWTTVRDQPPKNEKSLPRVGPTGQDEEGSEDRGINRRPAGGVRNRAEKSGKITAAGRQLFFCVSSQGKKTRGKGSEKERGGGDESVRGKSQRSKRKTWVINGNVHKSKNGVGDPSYMDYHKEGGPGKEQRDVGNLSRSGKRHFKDE